ncbi:hypothetical protein D8Y20_06255 [Mariprofundus sp. EBB-1]|uniref:YecA family protein n=1 Tax=Mariprofundus sp. EBB-1 TaxID=2650971 RepID=UPI000EF1C4E0|nr:SEC-C metal-binding domain-containing protein [Mariprofundus sp. EBB-1]RLL52849.1 hypothetical protein D8Y20_06255 [Mariprofundus sp. EBB-1]
MSKKVQRNAPCPCGSGKKYKKCCKVNERDQMVASGHRRDGVMHALTWVSDHYTKETDQWVDQVWLSDISEEQRSGIALADATIRSIHDVNLLEYLVAAGRYSDMEGEDRPLELILNAPELTLDEAQRAYLKQLSERPLRLYKVITCVAGESFTVSDAMLEKAEQITINDAYASRMLDVEDVVGLRLMQTPAGWEASGAVYHFPTEYLEELGDLLRAADDDAFSATMIHFWLKLVAAHV